MPSARGIERLARKMYEANHPGGTPWPRRGWDIRQVWLGKARQRIEGGGAPVERSRVWREIKLLLRTWSGRTRASQRQ
jgi:hypothetical protein